MTWEGLNPPYSTIVVDPPWPQDEQPMGYQRESGRRSFLPYSTMTRADLGVLPVSDLGTIDAHLWLWTTQRFLFDAHDLASEWGFTVGPVVVWCKEPMGTPSGSFMPTAEFLLVCRRRFGDAIRSARERAGLTVAEMQRAVRGSVTGLGSMWEHSVRYPSDTDWNTLRALLDDPLPTAGNLASGTTSTWYRWKRGAHSEKPEASYDLIAGVSPGPYVELFARRQRLGWDSHGWGYELSKAEG